MFGVRRRREAAAAEAAREAERRALFAQLAQRPTHICPFLGLAYERTGYVEGPSIEHRCFAFGEPAPLSSEQQTRVCQERGYGQCPRYLRGLLVTPSDDLQFLRNPRAAAAAAAAAEPPPPPTPSARRRRRRRVAALLAVLVLAGAGAGVGYLVMSGALDLGVGSAVDASPTASGSATPSASASPTARPSPTPPPPTASAPDGAVSPEPTPAAGDTFAFYEVFVREGTYTVYAVTDGGEVTDQGTASFEEDSFARVEPIEGGGGDVYWRTEEGGLAGFAYLYPDSGEFTIRAVFLNDAGARRSVFLEEDALTRFPEETPAP